MRNLILNKMLSVSVIFFLLLCFKGGDLSAWVMDSTNLSTWLEANKIGIAFNGADFSLLPAVAVIAGTLSASLFIHFVIETVFEALDAFTAAPEKISHEQSKEPTTKQTIGTSEKQEPTVSLPPADQSDDQEKR